MLSDAEIARFHTKIRSEAQCLIWTDSLDRDGYGAFWLQGRNRRAHRVAWFMHYGAIPAGAVINHVCRNRACVNPQHLEALQPGDHALRDSVSAPALNARKTHCPEGHEYDQTVVWGGKRQRVCSICQRAKQRRQYAKRRSQPDPLAGQV
jgi:hypothetical protein